MNNIKENETLIDLPTIYFPYNIFPQIRWQAEIEN